MGVVACVVVAAATGAIVFLTSQRQPSHSRDSTATIRPAQRKVESCVTSIAAPAAEAIKDLENFNSSAMTSVMAGFSVAHGAAEYGVLQSVVSNVSQNLTTASWAVSWKSAIKHELPTIESFCERRYTAPSTTTTTLAPGEIPWDVVKGMSCSVTSGPKPGIDSYDIPNLTKSSVSWIGGTQLIWPSMTFLAPTKMSCVKEFGGDGTGAGMSDGLKSTGKTPAWIWINGSRDLDNAEILLCSYSTPLKVSADAVGLGCYPPAKSPSSVRYLFGSSSSSIAAIELISQEGVNYADTAPYRSVPTHSDQAVFTVFAYEADQSENFSFSCSLPRSSENLCAQDAEIFVADLHLP